MTREGKPPRRATIAPVFLALCLIAAAAGLSAAAVTIAPPGQPIGAAAVAALLAVLTVAGTLQIQLQYADDVDASDLFDVALAPVLFTLAPPAAVLLALLAKAVSQAILRVPPVKALFNVAQWAAATAAGTLVLAVGRAAGARTLPAELLPLALALLAVAAVNHLAVVAVLRLVAGSPAPDDTPRTIAAAQPSRRWLYAAAVAFHVCCGLPLAVAFRSATATVVLALVPLVALNRAQRVAAARAADAERVDALRAASRALLVDDPHQALPSFLRRVCTGLGAAAVELVLADDDGLVVHRIAPGEPDRRWRAEPDDARADLLEHGDVLLCPPDPACPAIAAWLEKSGHRNMLAAPWRRPGGQRGVLCVYDRTGLRGYGTNLRQVTEGLARELADALARGDLLRRADSERARFTALVRGSSDLVLVVDRNAVVCYASEAANRVVNRSPDQLTGSSLTELFAAHQSSALRHWITSTAAASTATVPLVLELPVAGRLPRQIEAISRNLLDDPSVAGIVINARDVTESRRQAEVLELIAADAPLSEPLQLIATTVEELLPAAHCTVHVDPHTAATAGTDPAAAAGETTAEPAGSDAGPYAELARALANTVEPSPGAGRAPTVPLVLDDLTDDDLPLPQTLRRQLLDAGIAACWIWPLALRGELRPGNALTVLFTEQRRPLPAEHRLVSVAAKLAVNAIGRAQERQRLAYQATHDALTGLASRRVLRNDIELALARMRRSGATVAVLFADLDNFKIINDSLGHRVGDALLQEISRRLRALVRPEDTVARLGGDEFVVLCGDLPGPDEADAVAQRLLTLLGDPMRIDGHEFFVTASLGIAVASGPDHAPDLLMENADAAMYRAKAKGGNRYQVFDETMRTAAALRLSTRTSLRRALQQPDLRVHYQPTVDLVSGRLRGVEALVRWQHPSRGLLGPSEFIPLAEETGLIVPLGARVLVESCQQMAAWRAQRDDGPLELAVNLSPRQFASGDLVAVVERALDETGLEADALVLEITETCLMEDGVDIYQVLESLKKVGVQLAIDDFGTGYSSLAYLRHLPVDTLKLDQSFVRHVDQEGPDRAIAEMVMGLGRTLGLKTVAEGIETSQQLQTLQSLGCDVGQGFLLGRPVPPEQLDLRLLADGTELATVGRGTGAR